MIDSADTAQKGNTEDMTEDSQGHQDSVKTEIKVKLLQAGKTMKWLHEELETRAGIPDEKRTTYQNFVQKLNNLRYDSVKEIADVLGYDLVWQKRQQ